MVGQVARPSVQRAPRGSARTRSATAVTKRRPESLARPGPRADGSCGRGAPTRRRSPTLTGRSGARANAAAGVSGGSSPPGALRPARYRGRAPRTGRWRDPRAATRPTRPVAGSRRTAGRRRARGSRRRCPRRAVDRQRRRKAANMSCVASWWKAAEAGMSAGRPADRRARRCARCRAAPLGSAHTHGAHAVGGRRPTQKPAQDLRDRPSGRAGAGRSALAVGEERGELGGHDVAAEQPQQQVPVAGGQPGQMAPAGVERSESALRPIAACARLAVALIVSLLSAMVTMSLTLSATVARHVTADPAKPPDARRARPTGDAPAQHCPCEPARAARRRSAPPSRRRARCGSPSGSGAG